MSGEDGGEGKKGGESPGLAYEDRILAYVDVLGWRDIIRRSETDPSELEAIATALRSLREAEIQARRVRDHAAEQGREEIASEVTLFSDTAVISCRPHPVAIHLLLKQVQQFCVDLMIAGIFTRGAIVHGNLYHSDGFIVGPALVEAHCLESTVAIYPRIVLADNVVQLIRDLATPDGVTARVDEDRDMLLILDPFATGMPHSDRRDRMTISRDRALQNQKTKYSDIKIRAKMGWLVMFLTRQLGRVPATDDNASGYPLQVT